MTTISVVMATCNGADYILEQLASIEAQERRPDEVIISDDASDDATLAMIDAAMAGLTVKPRIFSQPSRLGYTRNFIQATARATGDLIVFCDQDDVWHPRKLRVLAEQAGRSERKVFYHDISIVFMDGRPTIASYHAHLRSLGFAHELCFKGCSCAVRRDFIAQWGWPAAEPSITYDLWLGLLSAACDERETIGVPLMQHRIHAANASGWLLGAGDRKPAPRYTARMPAAGALVDRCLHPGNADAWARALSGAAARAERPGERAGLAALGGLIFEKRMELRHAAHG